MRHAAGVRRASRASLAKDNREGLEGGKGEEKERRGHLQLEALNFKLKASGRVFKSSPVDQSPTTKTYAYPDGDS